MNDLLSISLILLLGFVAQKAVQKLKLPSVTAYLVLGILIGPYLLNLASPGVIRASGLFSEIALGIIAFSIGESFFITNLKKFGKSIFLISIFQTLSACLFIIIFTLFQQPLHISLILGAVGCATAPAATIMVIREYKAKGSFTKTLVGVVGMDDAWALILFAILLGLAKTLFSGVEIGIHKIIGKETIRIIGALVLGGAIGWIFAYFSKFCKTKSERLIYTLGFIFIGIGVSKFCNFSLLLTNMALGASVVNFSRMGRRYFEAMETVDPPLFLIFFVLCGANLEIPALKYVGVLGGIYIIARVAGKFIGTYIGASVAKANSNVKKYLGFGLIPQAGVALGMALYVKSYFPEVGNIILPVIIGSTVIYELIGPVCTKFALSRAGEISKS